MFAFISHLFCRSQGPTFWLNLPDQMKICRSGPTDRQFRQACNDIASKVMGLTFDPDEQMW